MASTMTSACSGHFDGFGDLAAIFGGIAGHHFILHPRAADGDLAAFAVEHLARSPTRALMPSRTVTSCLGMPL